MVGLFLLILSIGGGGLFLVRVPAAQVLLVGDRIVPAGLRVRAPWMPSALVPLDVRVKLGPLTVRLPDGRELEKEVQARVLVNASALRLSAEVVAGSGGWEGYLGEQVVEALERAAAGASAGDPLARVAVAAEVAVVAGALAGGGVTVEEVVVTTLPTQALRSYREARIQELMVPAQHKVLMVGLDGADWQVIDPMLRAGKLPALAGLIERGSRANLRSEEPMLSPLLWTTVATGKSPDEHGIIDFLLVEPETGRRVPMSSRFRKVKALWNILGDLGRRSTFIAWWATWPAEVVRGTMVTDRVSYSLFAGLGVTPEEGSAGLTFPPGYLDEVRDRLVRPEEIGFEEVRRFLHLDRAEFEAGKKLLGQPPESPPEHPVVALARVLAASRSYHAIALDQLRRGQPELLAVYYEGIDQIGHRFMHYAPPRMAMASDAQYERYRDAVSAFYVWQDRQLAELVRQAEDDTVFLLLSDHGFRNAGGRPRDMPPYVSGKPGLWHRRYGIFVLSGPGVRRGHLDTVTLFDIAPTVLHLLGLPVPEDMRGRVLEEALDALSPVAAVSVATYEGIGERSQAPHRAAQGGAVEAELVRELTALGYISSTVAGEAGAGPGEADAGPTANYHLNLASILARQQKYAEAETEIHEALQKAPLPDAYRLLSEVREKRADLPGAIEALRMSLGTADRLEASGNPGRGPGDAGRLRLVGLLLDAGQVDEAARMARPAAGFTGEEVAWTAQGLVAERDGRRSEAIALYRRALDRRATLSAAMVRLYPMLGPDELVSLEPIVRRGLQENDQLASYHNVLGVIYKARGDLRLAAQQYRRALGLDPDNVDYLANLGNAEMILGRLDEAFRVLESARRHEPENPDVWLALGAVHGKAGRAAESLQAFLHARALGADGPGVVVGLALAHLQLDDAVEARRVVQEGRQRFPADPTLAELQSVLP